MDVRGAGPESLVDVTGAARYLGTSVRFVRRLVSERRIRFYHVGRLVRLDLADLRAFVEANRVDPIRPGMPSDGRAA
jgi:excisionase family DNA binding protein